MMYRSSFARIIAPTSVSIFAIGLTAAVSTGRAMAAQTISGQSEWTQLQNFRLCTGDIANDDGGLKCNMQLQQPPPSGTYTQSCSHAPGVGTAWVNGTTLNADCQTISGQWRWTQLENFKNCMGDIANDDGGLKCDMRGQQRPPSGTYTQSCSRQWVNGTTLNADCQTISTVPGIRISATETQTGPDVCLTGSEFTPGGIARGEYVGIPGITVPIVEAGSTTVKPDGSFKIVDTTNGGRLLQQCSSLQSVSIVTIIVTETVSGNIIGSASGTMPGAYWCGNAHVSTNFQGGCP